MKGMQIHQQCVLGRVPVPKNPRPEKRRHPVTHSKYVTYNAERQAKQAQLQADAKLGAEAIGEPSLWKKGSHYAKALAKWWRASRPVRSEEEAARCEEICRSNQCGLFDAEAVACKKCGCKVSAARWAIASKTRMATEVCPKGLWK
jgi:hypothetical protein